MDKVEDKIAKMAALHHYRRRSSSGTVMAYRIGTKNRLNRRFTQIAIERLLIKPTMANQLLRRTIYEADGTFHVDAVRIGFSPHRIYAGGSTSRRGAAPTHGFS